MWAWQAKQELGTLFGNRAENNEVGITGDVEFVCLDGPSVIVRLTGRFWHAKADVSLRNLSVYPYKSTSLWVYKLLPPLIFSYWDPLSFLQRSVRHGLPNQSVSWELYALHIVCFV